MRAWENRADTMVLDEPLYSHYLAATGLDHPGRDEIMAAGPIDAAAAVGLCLEPLPAGLTVSYQKHMTHHLLASIDRSWLDQVRNFLLIRDPVPVLASYTQVRSDVTLDDLGLPQQVEVASRAELVIDAADFLTDPRAYLTTWCDHLGLEFSDRMLSWPAGRRASDGCWAPHWYRAVEASTGFGPAPDPSTTITVDDLPSPLRPLAREATELYHQLGVDRLRL